MSKIRLTKSRRGLAGFPAGYRVVGRDDLGDILAADDGGIVWCFAHGTGHWEDKAKAFADEDQLAEFVAFQHELAAPDDDETIDELRARRKRVEAFVRGRRGAPYAREAARAAIEDIKERVGDLRFASSSRGRSIADRQALGQLCEARLREADAGEDWMVRAHAERKDALIVLGPFDDRWTHDAVRTLLQPLVGPLELLCYGSRAP